MTSSSKKGPLSSGHGRGWKGAGSAQLETAVSHRCKALPTAGDAVRVGGVAQPRAARHQTMSSDQPGTGVKGGHEISRMSRRSAAKAPMDARPRRHVCSHALGGDERNTRGVIYQQNLSRYRSRTRPLECWDGRNDNVPPTGRAHNDDLTVNIDPLVPPTSIRWYRTRSSRQA